MGSDLIYNLDEVQMGAEEARRLAQFESVFVEPNAVARSGDTSAVETAIGDLVHPHKIRRKDDGV